MISPAQIQLAQGCLSYNKTVLLPTGQESLSLLLVKLKNTLVSEIDIVFTFVRWQYNYTYRHAISPNLFSGTSIMELRSSL